MKKLIGFFVLFTSLLAFQLARAQDVSINITNVPSIPLGTSTPILVTVCNEDPNPVDAPANKLRPQLSVSPNVTITGVTNTDGSPLTEFSVISTSSGNGNTVILLLTTPLLNGDCKSFYVTVKGMVVSGNIAFNGTLGFQGPQTPGNANGNDNSPSAIAVTAAPPVATDDNASTSHDTNITVNLLTNDTPGGAPLDPSSVKLIDPVSGNPVTSVTVPGEGVYTVNPDGTVTFDPDPTFSGPATPIKYTVTDTNGQTSNQATIKIDVDPLPVTLVRFNVTKEGRTAQLSWATTEETNSDRFEIEKSLNGKEWEMIGKVASNGESAVLRQYAFTDKSPSDGSNLYRLRMVDKDETFAYSRIQTVKFDGIGSDLSIYPNPVTDQLFLRDFSQVTKVIINDLNGRAVHQSGATTTGKINVQNLSAGMYIVTISRSNGLVSSQKIVVSR
jgi:CshA-type fibril repeat protein